MKFKTTLQNVLFKFVKKGLACNFVEYLQSQQNDQNRSYYESYWH